MCITVRHNDEREEYLSCGESHERHLGRETVPYLYPTVPSDKYGIEGIEIEGELAGWELEDAADDGFEIKIQDSRSWKQKKGTNYRECSYNYEVIGRKKSAMRRFFSCIGNQSIERKSSKSSKRWDFPPDDSFLTKSRNERDISCDEPPSSGWGDAWTVRDGFWCKPREECRSSEDLI